MPPVTSSAVSVSEMQSVPAALRFGAAYSLILPTRQDHDSLIRYLTGLDAELPHLFKGSANEVWLTMLTNASAQKVAVAAEDGAMLSWLDSWSNLILPLYYESPKAALAAEQRVDSILSALGEGAERFRNRSVSSLTLYERRLAGFVKSMLMEPQLLVLDSLFERLGRLEQLRITKWINLYRQRFPLRLVLYVGLAQLNDPSFLSGFTSFEVVETSQ